MRNTRIYINAALACGRSVQLPDDITHYVARVLRMSNGENIHVFNGSGGYYLAEFIAIKKHYAEIRLLEHFDDERESTLKITLAQGISRGQKMDYTIQKAVELGVTRIVPLITEYSNVRLDDKRSVKRREHWQKIIIHSCEQCGRNRLPLLEPVQLLCDWLNFDHSPTKLLLDPMSSHRLSQVTAVDKKLSLLAGPEGGFSEDELQQVRTHNVVPVCIGPRILRTETAALAAISAIQTLWGDMG